MTATATRGHPELADPGHGRRWEWELAGSKPRQRRWFASLVSRSGNVLGYIGEYDNGWGGNARTRSKSRHRQFRPLLGAWATAEVAAEMLLRELRRR